MPFGSPSHSATCSHCACRIDAEDAAERNVGHVQVAGGVEHRPFEERVGRLAAAVGVGPVGATPVRRKRSGIRVKTSVSRTCGGCSRNMSSLLRGRGGGYCLLERGVRGDLAPVGRALAQILRERGASQ